MARDHRKLRAFVLADELVLAVSVAANIVEGCARKGQGEYVNFLNIAFGSLREVGYYITLAPRLGFVSPAIVGPLTAKYDEAATVLAHLINAL